MKKYFSNIGLVFVVGLLVIFSFYSAGVQRGPEISSRFEENVLPFSKSSHELRFAIATMVSARETFFRYRQMAQYVSGRFHQKLSLVIRPTYREVQDLLETGQIDLAFVCTGTYLHTLKKKRAKILVVPEFRKSMKYCSSIIVLKSSYIHSFRDLRGKKMAFSDPDSNTGYIVPISEFFKRKIIPEKFLSRMVITGSHDRSIQAVLLGAVDVAAVDDMVLHSYLRIHHDVSDKITIIWQSEIFGNPPIMIPGNLSADSVEKLRKIFLSMHKDDAGRSILNAIGITRFALPRPDDYFDALKNLERIEKFHPRGHGT